MAQLQTRRLGLRSQLGVDCVLSTGGGKLNVDEAASGFTASELQSLLHVECKRALLKLYRERRLAREAPGPDPRP